MPQTAKLLHDAIALHKAQRFQDAEKAYRKLLGSGKPNPDGLRLLGALYLQTGQKALAADFLEKATRLRPQDPETLTNLGIALCGLQRRDAAAARFRQALACKNDYVPALKSLGILCHEIGQINEAEHLYQKIAKLHPNQPAAHFDYGNALLSLGRTVEAIERYEHALALKPDYLDAMVNLGMALGLSGQNDASRQWLERAQELFEKILEKDPQNSVALNNLGNILRQQGKSEDAATRYREALRLRPDYAEATINLATALRDLRRWDEAIDCCQSALRLKPDSVEARINLGTFLQEKGRHAEAVAAFTEALALHPSSVDAQWNKSLSLLALGEYEEGWKLHETGLGIGQMRGAYTPAKRWNGEPLDRKRLLIRAEQGYGDTLQFIRYASLCKKQGATVVVSCPAALRSLFSNSPFIDELPETLDGLAFDFHVPVMSLPFAFKTTVETIPATVPYLDFNEAVRARWAEKIPDGEEIRAGLVWAGNPREKIASAHLTDQRRSIGLDALRPLLDVPNIRFYSLQKDAAAEQIDRQGLRGRINDPMSDVRDFQDTAALIDRLDLVISVDTAVAHLAGALGKPVWILSRFDACWRWLQNRPDSPWYPTARVFGQKQPGDWADVVERIKNDLSAFRKRGRSCP